MLIPHDFNLNFRPATRQRQLSQIKPTIPVKLPVLIPQTIYLHLKYHRKYPSDTPSITSVTSSDDSSRFSLPSSDPPSHAPSIEPPDHTGTTPLSPPHFILLRPSKTKTTNFKNPTVFSTYHPSLAPTTPSSVTIFHPVNLLPPDLPIGASVLPQISRPLCVPSLTTSLNPSMLPVFPGNYTLRTPSYDPVMDPSLVLTVFLHQEPRQILTPAQVFQPTNLPTSSPSLASLSLIYYESSPTPL